MEHHMYTVIVGNIGTVYRGPCAHTARTLYSSYMGDSKANYGRASGESVYLFEDDEISRAYLGLNDTEV